MPPATFCSTVSVPRASRTRLKLDATFVLQKSVLRDPFTGEKRNWSGFVNRQANFELRHDIPNTDWAWSMEANHNHIQARYRSNEVDRSWEGPWFVSAEVENKNVLGMTVAAGVGNILDARSYRDRTVFTGIRGQSPIDFIEDRNRRIGPIFYFSLRGNI